jgi:hypothetical protein
MSYRKWRRRDLMGQAFVGDIGIRKRMNIFHQPRVANAKRQGD